MDVQFNKSMLGCMQPVMRQAQTQEQTQEVRLPEGMPDIGAVVACWAQPVIRGKEWRSDKLSVNGGVMAWVLYTPEDGDAPQSVSAWLPWQMKWEIPQGCHDGTILAQPFMRSVDARSLSARKMMVRANVGVMMEALAPGEVELYTPGELPEDICLLKKSYPLQIPKEAGEKAFQIEENIPVSGSLPKVEQLVRYELRPELTDIKLMADKLVFRGTALLHVLYRDPAGQLQSLQQEVPLSQYADLDGEYGAEASAFVLPVITNLELDLEPEGNLRLKTGMAGQYVVYDTPVVEVVEDAYSPMRQVTPQVTNQQLPAVLDAWNQTMRVEQSVEADAMRVADLAFYPDAPQQMQEADAIQLQLPGTFQVLYNDPEGMLQSTNAYWEETQEIPTASGSILDTAMTPVGKPQAGVGSNGISMQADLLVQNRVRTGQGMPMVTGLEMGELTQPDPERPSLILRKAGNRTLWEIAKAAGATVEDILQANSLTQEPSPEQMLLIPVR